MCRGLFVSLQDVYGIAQDVDSQSLITRANYVSTAATPVTVATVPLFYNGINLKSGDSIHSGINLNNQTLIFRTKNTPTANVYVRIFMYYSLCHKLSMNTKRSLMCEFLNIIFLFNWNKWQQYFN